MKSKEQKIVVFVGAAQGLARYGLSIANALNKHTQLKVVVPSNITTDTSLTSLLEDLQVISYEKLTGSSFLRTIISVIRVYYQLIRFNPQLVHETSGATYFSNLLFLPFFLFKPMVVTEHEPVERHQSKISFKKRITSYMYSHLANSFIVHGPFCKEMLNKNINLKNTPVHIIHHGAYNFYRLLSKDKVERNWNEILFFGSLRPDKGFEHLPTLIDLLDMASIPFTLVVACNPEWPEELNSTKWPSLVEKTMEFLQSHPKVVVENRFIPDEEVGRYFKRASIILLPYNSATQSGVVTIGLTFGSVPVAFNVGDLGYMIKHQYNGILVDKGDFNQMAESIIALINDQSDMKKLSENALNYSETALNWNDEIVEKHLQLYQQLLNK
ncbi:MAG: glycosyltransferase family 4 protein [Ekhidna sp.]|uniref:glycosyltransferase family 4 protein n=1 Tax=Ekhidna sp. TaxID=2608089 RepID=UPI0032ED094A